MDSTCRACSKIRISDTRTVRLLCCSLVFLALLFSAAHGSAQCASGSGDTSQIQALYQSHQWDAVISAAKRTSSRSADVNFEYGMALAHLQRWREAHAVLMVGSRQCPKQKRFPIELAGVAFQQKQFPEAASWIRKGLRLDPRDEYANEFAGTVYLLMGNLDAALKYWNRIRRPYINALQIDPNLRVERLQLERAFVFSPQSIMQREDLPSTQARLDAMGIFPAYSIKLDAQPEGKFNAQFNAIERNGFGNGRLQSLISVFSGLPYETIYPSYFNVGRSATNLDSLIRWDSEKRRAWVSLSGPLRHLPQWRWQLQGDARQENWAIRNSFTGAAPVLGSFKLTKAVAAGTVTSIHSGRFQWTSGAELSHRSYSGIVAGSALTPQIVSSGYELKYLARANVQVLDLPERRLTVSAAASSEFARLWSNPARLFDKTQGGMTLHWWPQAEGDRYEIQQRVRGGGIAGTAPLDELWMIGVERDNDLWLRGHIGTRDGRKGSSPLADRFLLSNTDFYCSIWGNGLISIKAGPFLDIARASSTTSALAPREWLFDTGVEAKLSVLGTSVVLTYGRDLRAGNNAFYGSIAQR